MQALKGDGVIRVNEAWLRMSASERDSRLSIAAADLQKLYDQIEQWRGIERECVIDIARASLDWHREAGTLTPFANAAQAEQIVRGMGH